MFPHDLDLRDVHTVEAIRNLATGDTAEVQLRPVSNGFSEPTSRDFPLEDQDLQEGLFVYWTVIRNYAISERSLNGPPALIQSFDTQVVARRRISANLRAYLHCRNGLDDAKVLRIRQTFSAFDPTADYTITEYLAAFLTANTDIVEGDMALAYSYVVTAEQDSEDSDSDLLGRVQLDDEFSDVILIRTQAIDELVMPIPHPNEQEVGPGDSHADVVRDVDERSALGCEGMTIQEEEFARTRFVPEVRHRWSRKRVRIGRRCWTWIPWLVVETRETDLVAYFYARHPVDIGDYARDIVVDCARNAAVEASVLAIVFVDLGAFVPAFKSLFARCIHDKFSQMVHCLEASVVILKEPRGPWR